MALSASIVWEIRTTGSDSNGGGFKTGASGTDYSQQDSAQYALTGLTSSGAGAVILTSSAAADMVGNLIQITGGTNFTTGFYEITSVSAGVSITVDRNCTTGAGAAGTGNIGGAVATINTVNNNKVLGNKAYIKSGTYTVTTRQDWSGDAYAWDGTNPTILIGYNTTRGDNPKGNGRPVISCNTAGVDAFGIAGDGIFAMYLIVDGNDTARNGVVDTGGVSHNRPVLLYVTVKRFSTYGIKHFQAVDSISLIRCRVTDMKSGSSFGIYLSGSTIIECIVDNCPCDGISNNTDYSKAFIRNSISCHNTGNGVLAVGELYPGIFHDNIFYKNSNTGLNKNGGYQLIHYICNNVSYGNGGYGMYGPAIGMAVDYINYNAYGSNTSGNLNGFTAGPNDVTLTADPFTGADATSVLNAETVDDIFALFKPNNTSGGGAAIRGVGYPAYRDIGAVQHQDSGTGNIINIINRIKKVR